MLNNPCHKEIPPNVQPKSPLAQLEPVSSYLDASCLGDSFPGVIPFESTDRSALTVLTQHIWNKT